MNFDLSARDRVIDSDLIVSLDLGARTTALLTRSGYVHLGQLADVDAGELLRGKGFDRTSLEELVDALFVRGLRLADEEERKTIEAQAHLRRTHQ